MNKKNAMTLIEIMLVIAVIGVIMSISVGVVKKRIDNKDNMTIISTLYDLQRISNASLQKVREQGRWSYGDETSAVCLAWADMANTKSQDCNNGNFVMTNGVSVFGFTESKYGEDEDGWANQDTTPQSPKHPYKDITFDINGYDPEHPNENLPNQDGKDQYTVRIFKDESIIVPITDVLLEETSIVKYRVIVNRELQNNTYVNTYRVVSDNLNFGSALCYIGGATEFYAQDASCSSNPNCNRYFDCSIQIMNVPNSVVKFKGNIN